MHGGICSPFMDVDVFWVWTPLVSGDYYFRTCSGSINTEINLHLGDDCSATCLATADTGGCGFEWHKATMRVDGLVAGQNHLLQVGAWISGNAGGSIEVLLAPPPPANDTCAAAAPIQGLGTFSFDRTSATSSGFGSQSAGPCSAAVVFEDTFFQWTALQAGDYMIRDCSFSFPYGTEVWLFAGTGCSAVCISGFNNSSCNRPSLILSACQ